MSFRSIGDFGHSTMNAIRSVGQSISSGAGKLWNWMVSIGSKPEGDLVSADKVDIESTPGDKVSIGDRVIEDYGVSEQMGRVEAMLNDLLDAVQTEHEVGGGEDFSEAEIITIKEGAKAKAMRALKAQHNEGKLIRRDDIPLVLENAIFDAMLELEQNKGMTPYQKDEARHYFEEQVGGNAAKRVAHPEWNIPEVMGIPRVQGYLDEQNPLTLLSRVISPIMPDVREEKKKGGDEWQGIQSGQNGTMFMYLGQLQSLRAQDPDKAVIDDALRPKLMKALSAEAKREGDEVLMTNEQFKALADLYKEIAGDSVKENELYANLLLHPRLLPGSPKSAGSGGIIDLGAGG